MATATLNRDDKATYRFRAQERDLIRQAARTAKMRESEFVRRVLVSAAQRRVARQQQAT